MKLSLFYNSCLKTFGSHLVIFKANVFSHTPCRTCVWSKGFKSETAKKKLCTPKYRVINTQFSENCKYFNNTHLTL